MTSDADAKKVVSDRVGKLRVLGLLLMNKQR